MVMLDANMILRYLLNDNEEMAQAAEDCIRTGTVVMTIEVAAEVVYVLRGVYHMDRKRISACLRDFLNLVDCPEKETAFLALKTYGEQNLDFVDCVLYAYHRLKGVQIATFDKKLLRLTEAESVPPPAKIH